MKKNKAEKQNRYKIKINNINLLSCNIFSNEMTNINFRRVHVKDGQ